MSGDDGVELSLIIPAYNEEAIIAGSLRELCTYMDDALPQVAYEIIVVDDGSTDQTVRTVEEVARMHPGVRSVVHERNRGRGKAVRTGFEAAQGGYIICLDADLSYSPEHIARLLEPLKAGVADITLASAYNREGTVKNVPASRALMSRLGNIVLSAGLKSNISTATCIVRGFRREAIDKMELINDGKDLHLEILQKAELFGLRILEIPGHLKWRNRNRKARSKVGVLDHIPFFSMSNTIASHLVYSYVLRPGTMLNAPVIGLLIVFLTTLGMFLWAWATRLLGPGGFGFSKIYNSLRDTLLAGGLTFVVMVSSLLFLIILIAFYFASQQNKRHHDEVYVLLNRMNTRLKALERERND